MEDLPYGCFRVVFFTRTLRRKAPAGMARGRSFLAFKIRHCIGLPDGVSVTQPIAA